MTLKQQTFSAVRWSTVAMAGKTTLAFIQIVVLARLLSPEDFGLMAIVTSFVAILGLFSDLGLGKAIIHHAEITPDQLSSLYWLNLGASLLLMFALAGVAPLIGWLYSDYRLVSLLIVASFAFPLIAIGYQFRMLAEKTLHFSSLAVVEVVGALFGFGCAIAVAIADGGVWAIVIGMLAGAASTSALAWWRLSTGWRPSWHLRISECTTFLRFGGYSVGETLANSVRMQMDVFIGGLLLGPTTLGLYSLPRDLSLRIAFIINPIVTRVGFPVMVQVQGDTARLKSVYLQTLRMTASINFPVYVGLILFAQEVIVLLFGEQWQSSTVYLQIFATMGLIRSTGNPSGSLVYAVGRARRAFWWNIALLVIIPPIFFVGALSGGSEGLAWSMLIAQIGVFVPAWMILVRPLCGASFAEYIGQLIRPLLMSLAAAGCTYSVIMGFEHGLTRLSIGLTVGAVVYLGLSLKFNQEWVATMIQLFNINNSCRANVE